jgi:hypothetical protein
MRLADPENADAIADCASIREADVKLRKHRDDNPDDEGDDEAEDGAGDEGDDPDDDAQRVVQRAGASPDLTTTFKNTAVDEVYSALTQAWERDHIRDLANRLLRFLGPPAPPPNESALRRSVTQPMQ